MMDFNRERSGNIVLLALFMSSWWVLEFCRTTATSCILTAWWRWHRTALMQTRSLMANAWLRQRCCVQAPQSSLVLHTSLSLWTPCTTKGGRRSQGPWWGADTSLGERERSSSVYWVFVPSLLLFTAHPFFLFHLHFLFILSAHISKIVWRKRVCYCRWKRQDEVWRWQTEGEMKDKERESEVK